MKQYLSYAFGAFGHDAFFAAFGTYFMIFITSQLFTSNDAGFNAKMIGILTTLVVVIRLAEIAFDPFIGGMIDNTQTRWGKFKPWLFAGATIGSLGLILLFSNFWGLNLSNPILYLILFGIVFAIVDIFYSFKDISFWSMLPALSIDSDKRAKIGTVARFGSTLGSQGVMIAVVPLVVLFSQMFSGTTGNTETRAGWLGFAIVIALVSFLGAMATCWGTKEQQNVIRKAAKKIHLREVFKIIGKNDQLMWLAFSYFLLAFGYVVTNNLLLYYFKYVLGRANEFYLVGIITAILGIVSVAIFPALVRIIKRKAIYTFGILFMLIGYLIFLFAGNNLVLVLIGISFWFFPYPMIFLAALMTITDSVEYGQLKNGNRNESVTLAVRPLLDKLGGALANGVVGIAAIATGMTGNALPSDISTSGLWTFKFFIFFGPMILIALAALIYTTKVKLTEAKHDEIVNELNHKLGGKQG
ncbi:glycoside-pentoside-hexuronide (GPH):cation symporter [Sporolactobacillus sp. Y61]|uniref:Glycoside-pentoside-hexuronide (GPH):cation symporter n=1 Tax=Sporolactobacillus sp. Y61 TaxID=3160863 RepID=A0AAU8IIH1_9BACL